LVMSELTDALIECERYVEPMRVGRNAFRLACHLERPATPDEIFRAWPNREMPSEAIEMWTLHRAGELFVDVDFGQWGLRLLDPSASAVRTALERRLRPADITDSDVVLGEFLGDLELLVVDGTGRPMIALPLDSRDDWFVPAETLGNFLAKYVRVRGDKFWER